MLQAVPCARIRLLAVVQDAPLIDQKAVVLIGQIGQPGQDTGVRDASILECARRRDGGTDDGACRVCA